MQLLESIEAHFSEILKAKDELRNLTEELKSVNENDIRIHAEGMKTFWSETSGERIEKKEMRIYESISRESDAILKIVDEIDQTAEYLYRIEGINSALGLSRNY